MRVEDVMIAAVTQSADSLRITKNSKGFDLLPDLQVFNPWDYLKQ